jgi:hypothetical protein
MPMLAVNMVLRVWRMEKNNGGGFFNRFIPTGVGNSRVRTVPARSASVHPHGRGEQVVPSALHPNVNGSSPRAWGTGLAGLWPPTVRRFIPTGVGNRTLVIASHPATAVHPHGRGEQLGRFARQTGKTGSSPRATETTNGGSSPRAWGTDRRRKRARADQRFIPTGVGNSKTQMIGRGAGAVHPHGRGEQATMMSPRQVDGGSSPRAWGTDPIPRRYWRCTAVHPHGRGEQSWGALVRNPADGSSPRAWGTGAPDA